MNILYTVHLYIFINRSENMFDEIPYSRPPTPISLFNSFGSSLTSHIHTTLLSPAQHTHKAIILEHITNRIHPHNRKI